MPHHDKFDPQINTLAEAFGRAAAAMLRAVLAFVRGGASLEAAMKALDEVAAALQRLADEWVQAVLPAVYADGAREALNSPETPDVDGSALTREAHEQSLRLFQDDLSEELAAATRKISEDAKQSIREIGRRRLAAAMDNGTNARDEARRMEEDLNERGVSFVDKGGRRWKPRDYATMVLRTHTVSVSNEANLNSSAELGSPGVRVFDGGPGDVDEPCQQANGQRWSLAYARANRLEHPNCRRAFAPLPSTFSGELDKP